MIEVQEFFDFLRDLKGPEPHYILLRAQRILDKYGLGLFKEKMYQCLSQTTSRDARITIEALEKLNYTPKKPPAQKCIGCGRFYSVAHRHCLAWRHCHECCGCDNY